jgi:hypothetical protein
MNVTALGRRMAQRPAWASRLATGGKVTCGVLGSGAGLVTILHVLSMATLGIVSLRFLVEPGLDGATPQRAAGLAAVAGVLVALAWIPLNALALTGVLVALGAGPDGLVAGGPAQDAEATELEVGEPGSSDEPALP